MTDILFRARLVLLALLIALALGAGLACYRLGIRPEAPLALCAAFVILAVAALLLLRHIGLAAVVVLAPAMGWPAALLLAAVFVPDMPYVTAQAFGILPGFLIGCLLAARIAAGIADGQARDAAIRETMRNSMRPLLCALTAAVCTPVLAGGGLLLTSMIAVLVCGCFAMLAVPLAASLFSFGEDFVARFNRVRESRARLLAWLAPVTTPRWGWSLSGVAVILVALGYFGAPPHAVGMPGRWGLIWAGGGGILLLAALAAMRDWRRALAALLCCVPVAFLIVWAAGRAWLNPDAVLGMLQLFGFGASAAFAISALAPRDDAATASVRVLERDGPTIAIVMIASVLTVAVLLPPAVPTVLFGAIGALVFTSAFTTGLERLVPRRETIEARYKVR